MLYDSFQRLVGNFIARKGDLQSALLRGDRVAEEHILVVV